MSYIRSSSNPENLYIWGDEEDVYISIGSNVELKKVPIKTFNGLLKKYHKNFHKVPCAFKSLKIEEVWVKVDDKQYVLGEVGEKIFDDLKTEVRMKLSYENWHIYMWFVTWEYIVYSKLSHV